MRKLITFCCFLLALFPLFSQTKTLEGRVYDAYGSEPIKGASIQNMRTHKYAFTNSDGEFTMSVQLNDSLMITSSSHRQLIAVIDNFTFNRGKKSYLLYIKPFMLPGVTIISLNPTYEGFKKDVASRQLSESYKNLEANSHLSKEQRRNATYTEEAPNILKNTKLASPITFLYNTFNKKMKMKRLYYELESYGDEVEQVPQKFNREMVMEITGLKDPELTEFMVFCHFSYYDLIRWSREEIISTIRYKFDEYQYYKAIQDMDDY